MAGGFALVGLIRLFEKFEYISFGFKELRWSLTMSPVLASVHHTDVVHTSRE